MFHTAALLQGAYFGMEACVRVPASGTHMCGTALSSGARLSRSQTYLPCNACWPGCCDKIWCIVYGHFNRASPTGRCKFMMEGVPACQGAISCALQEVVRPLVLDERMTALAAAISIDYDYFSQHSHGPGMMPGFLFPMPIPTPSYPDPDAAPGADAGKPLQFYVYMCLLFMSVLWRGLIKSLW